MSILFLDIDGVLASTRSSIALGGYPHSFKPTCMAKFDWVAVGLVRFICAKTSARVVISSTWRRSHLWSDIGRNLDLPVIGSTPVLNTQRGNEIALWLSYHDEVTEYCIIDDDSDMLPGQRKHFVHVNGDVGLSLDNTVQALKILGASL